MTTSKQRQAAFRKRNADLGRTELRGIFATDAEQKILKEKIRQMLADSRKT